MQSFGGPEGPDDVMPFLRNVVRGRGVPDERLAVVAAHYDRFGGVSPINAQNRDLLAALGPALTAAGIDLPVYWGNRNWHPMIEDTAAQMVADGVTSALAFPTSAFSSFSSCKQYKLDLARASDAVEGPLRLDKLRLFYDHPGFITAQADRVRETVLAMEDPAGTRLVFTAHSIPVAMAQASQYLQQLGLASRLVTEAVTDVLPGANWDLVFQSRSGPPQVAWLEPDVNDHLRHLHDEGVRRVVLVPIGFVSDHVEVIFDLDTEAVATAAELGLELHRAATVGTHPSFVAMIVELVRERLEGAPRRALGPDGAWPDSCLTDCCPIPQRPPA